MNIMLTSAGIKMPTIRKELLKVLPKPPSELKLAHIVTASRKEANTDYVERDRAALQGVGFQVTDVSLEDLTPDNTFEELDKFDIVYVQGGNTFYLLKQARACGFEQAVRKFLQNPNKWYIGVSAGSYIACPTTEMGNWKREKDQHGLDDLTGLNFVPFLLSVHYNREKYREVLAEKIPTANYPVKILTDDQAFLIRNEKVELIGEGPEILASSIVNEDGAYHINEPDIASALRWLKVNDPENATREQAIGLLKDLKAGFHSMAHNNPDLLNQLKQELDSDKTQDQE